MGLKVPLVIDTLENAVAKRVLLVTSAMDAKKENLAWRMLVAPSVVAKVVSIFFNSEQFKCNKILK